MIPLFEANSLLYVTTWFVWLFRGSIFPWFKFYFSLSLGIIMYDNEVKTKESKL